jgi:hypothetical protein
MRQDPRTRVYLPGTALTSVAFSILQRYDVRGVLHPFVESLNRELAETVHLAILDGTMVRFIDAVESPQATRVASRLGKVMPANCTSTGETRGGSCRSCTATPRAEVMRVPCPAGRYRGVRAHAGRNSSALVWTIKAEAAEPWP